MSEERSNLGPVNERYTPPRSWAEVLGDEDLSVYQPQDQQGPPKPNSSAVKHANEVRAGERENRRERNREINEAARQVEDRKEAYDRVQEALRTRRPSSPADQAKAAQYALEQGIVKPKSSVQRLIEQGQRQRRAS
jgi:molecular chaperone GrpE (heat shock protein)